jgi:uncharacterized membrane-anchored protein YhcB (DUF1043 family)
MVEAVVTGILGGLLLLMLGWLKSDITKIGRRLDTQSERIEHRLDTQSERIEHRLDTQIEKIGNRFDIQSDTFGSRLDAFGTRLDALNDRTAEMLGILARTEGKLDEHLRQHH